MKSITVQQLEAMFQSGVIEVTHCGDSLLVETKMGSMELPLSCLDTFTPKVAPAPEVDSHAETRKMVKSAASSEIPESTDPSHQQILNNVPRGILNDMREEPKAAAPKTPSSRVPYCGDVPFNC